MKKLKEIYDQELSENEIEHSTSLSILKSQHEEVFRGTAMSFIYISYLAILKMEIL